jgi:hypothetical protein
MPIQTHAATLPRGDAMLDKDLGEVGLIAGIGAVVTWLVQRLVNQQKLVLVKLWVSVKATQWKKQQTSLLMD